jgi:lipopolysaccharide/colanic/teichoic acid biosynthesis glycosyltransferase
MEDFARMAKSAAVYEDSPETIESDLIVYESLWPTDHPVFTKAPVNSWRYQYVKRAIDFSSALIMVIMFTIPGLLIAAAILLTSKGPVFYREQRIGRNGRFFQIWKFRSMHRKAAQHECLAGSQVGGDLLQWRMHKQGSDPRITLIGGFLRRWSLDELPQLFNVLRGEMSLIGPRPIVERETAFYGDRLPFYLAVDPGLSGLWQVSGRSNIGYKKRARLDALYVKSWSLRTDIGILFQTIPVVLGREGAC